MKTLFKYSILLSLHYYDIIYHNTPNDFEKDNPIISLRVYDENNEII